MNLKVLRSTKGRAASGFWLRDQSLGKKKSGQEQVALIDPASGFLVYEPKDIEKFLWISVSMYFHLGA